MINLIPNEEKKKIRKDFYMRVVIVSFFVLGLSILVSNIMLIPALFYASLEKDIANTNLGLNQSELNLNLDDNKKDLISVIENKISTIKKSQASKFLVSERIIMPVLNKKNEGIKINSIDLSFDNNGDRKINLKGKASSREKLLSFKKSFSQDINFKNVDLPISNFVKSTDIEFNLILIPS